MVQIWPRESFKRHLSPVFERTLTEIPRYFYTTPTIFESEDGYAACVNSAQGSPIKCSTEEVGHKVVCERHSLISGCWATSGNVCQIKSFKFLADDLSFAKSEILLHL